MAKRQKTVFPGAQVAHVWAQQNQAYGKSSHDNLYFEGDTIFSYGSHFPIARFVERKGKKAVLFTTASYSRTTGKHKNYVSDALRGLDDVPVFKACDLRDMRFEPESATAEKGFANYKATLAERVALFPKTTPWNLEREFASFATLVNEANGFAKFFGLRSRLKAPVFPEEMIAKIEARIAKRTERRNAFEEKRRVANAEAETRLKAEYLLGQHHYLATQDWGLGASFTAEEHAQHEVAFVERQTRLVQIWRDCGNLDHDEKSALPHHTMLRVNGDAIETSRDAEFPLDHGIKAFAFILERRSLGQAWEKNGHSIHLGSFTIDRIEADGTVKAGCHIVPLLA